MFSQLRRSVNPFFSIVIPTYRRREPLRGLLRSLACQTLAGDKFQVIVVNNSPDIGIDDIITDFVAKLQITGVNEPGSGAHRARNLGGRLARGRYLLFLDDDCEAHPSLLEKYYAAASTYHPVIAGGNIEVKWDQTPPGWVVKFEHLLGKTNHGDGTFWLGEGQFANGGNLLIQREFFLQIGGMEPDQVGKIILGSGDVALSLSANQHGHRVLWVGAARAWHHQKKAVNARIHDLLRREFNHGIMIAYESRKRKPPAPRMQIGRITLRLLINSLKQASHGFLGCNLHALISCCLGFSTLLGAHWFYFYKSRSGDIEHLRDSNPAGKQIGRAGSPAPSTDHNS